jgi:peptidoglycan/LPS O-acetylase OafA/YrhL
MELKLFEFEQLIFISAKSIWRLSHAKSEGKLKGWRFCESRYRSPAKDSEMAECEEVGASRLENVVGLDSVRFLAALCVALGHGANFPLGDYVPAKVGIWRLLADLNENMFNGTAAVLVFFVVSGFCIHYRFAAGASFRTGPFLCRRILRIAIPMVVAMTLARLAGEKAVGAVNTVIWTLFCELIYYALYPALRIGFRRFGALACTLIAFGASLALILAKLDFALYWQFTIFLTWLVCLPVWLLGCLLAESVAIRKPTGVGREVWLWRAIGWSYATLEGAYFIYGPVKIGHPILMLPFGVYLFFWMEREISYFQQTPPPAVLEWAGKWSYSVYLIHPIVLMMLLPLAETLNPTALWAVKLIAILAASYTFYALVERPARQLGRSAEKYLARRSPVLGLP